MLTKSFKPMEQTETLTHTDQKEQANSFANPYPGLRPFLPEESHLFFGREEQVSEVIQKLLRNKFIAIIGNSGIGKSSFINCGILPALRKKSKQWMIYTFRPGNNPLQELTLAFNKLFMSLKDQGYFSNDLDLNTLLNDADSSYLLEKVKTYTQMTGHKLLLYIDQFEETFRYHTNDQQAGQQLQQFIQCLVALAESRDIPVYISLTMRSDYIGECSKFPELTSLVNDSQFLIPQMTREEKRRAIVGPAHIIGCQINEQLVEEILDKMGDDTDRLPVMQHALMRTWNYWDKQRIGMEEINLSHYQAIGGMESALSVHANEIFNQLPEDLKIICEKCFKSLTEKGEEGRSYRKPAEISQLADIAQTSNDNVITIVEAFRKPGNTLLTPSVTIELNESTIVDISHESIMRIWETLILWMEEEYESTKQYLRIAEAAELHQSGKGTLLKSPELQMATNWYHQMQPTKAWGIRHNIAYDRTIEYLLYSEKQFLREQRLKTRQEKRRLFIARAIALVFGTGALIAGLLVVYAIKQKNEAHEQKVMADAQAQRAEEQSNIALENAEEALKQTKIAELQAHKARKKEQEANISREKAEIERQNAIEQTEIAKQAEHKAMLEEQKALKLRMFSIARSMAVKSLQESDIVTRSLVSRQAYNFYYNNGGTGTDPDVYNALYYAIKELKGKDFSALSGHQDNVRSIVTNGNFSRFYSASSDGKIIQWTPRGQFDFSSQTVWNSEKLIHLTTAVSSDGKWLVTGGNYPYLLLFDLSNPKGKPEKIAINSGQILFAEFTPDNRNIVFVNAKQELQRYDFSQILHIASVEGKINAFDLDADGVMATVGLDNGSVLSYSIKGSENNYTLFNEPGGQAITSLRYSENGRMLALGNIRGVVRIIDVDQREEVASLTGHTARVNQICFNHSDTRVASASFDHTVRIWDINDIYTQPVILNDHKDWVWSIGFSADDNYLFAGCRDKLVRCWIMDIDYLADGICSDARIDRQLTQKEWNTYVGEDVELECTCTGACNE